jgi:hypothetical protein
VNPLKVKRVKLVKKPGLGVVVDIMVY